jgi:hypothetical protein
MDNTKIGKELIEKRKYLWMKGTHKHTESFDNHRCFSQLEA